MALMEEHYDLIEEMDSPLIKTVERFYRENPSKYYRNKIIKLPLKLPSGDKKKIQTHIIKHLERSPQIQKILWDRYVEQQFPSPPPAPPPPKPEVQYRRVTIKGYHVPRQRYYTEERRHIPGFGYRTVSVIHYKKAYDVKPYSYLVEK